MPKKISYSIDEEKTNLRGIRQFMRHELQQDYVSTQQVRTLGIMKDTLENLRDSSKIRSVYFKGKWFYLKDDLLKYLPNKKHED